MSSGIKLRDLGLPSSQIFEMNRDTLCTLREQLDEIQAKHSHTAMDMVQNSLNNQSRSEALRRWKENREAIAKVKADAMNYLAENL